MAQTIEEVIRNILGQQMMQIAHLIVQVQVLEAHLAAKASAPAESDGRPASAGAPVGAKAGQ